MADDEFYTLPADLPVPVDDGACDHLPGKAIPGIALDSTAGGPVDLSKANRPLVLFAYPRTGQPGHPVPEGWDATPGARGCTPQTCAFRDHERQIAVLGYDVYGLSTQDTAYQKEMTNRLRVPFPVLSDEGLEFTSALALPTLRFGGMTLIKRLTLIVSKGVIEKVFYPVFPPHENPDQVVAWLTTHRG